MLSFTRAFLQWRRGHSALRAGRGRFLDAPEPVLALVREDAAEAVLCVFNMGAEPVRFALPAGLAATTLDGHGLSGRLADGTVELPGWGGYFATVKK